VNGRCPGQIKLLNECKEHSSVPKIECRKYAIDVANCAAQSLCRESWDALRMDCKADRASSQCGNSIRKLDECFASKGLPRGRPMKPQ